MFEALQRGHVGNLLQAANAQGFLQVAIDGLDLRVRLQILQLIEPARGELPLRAGDEVHVVVRAPARVRHNGVRRERRGEAGFVNLAVHPLRVRVSRRVDASSTRHSSHRGYVCACTESAVASNTAGSVSYTGTTMLMRGR